MTSRLAFASAPLDDIDRQAVRSAGYTHVIDLRNTTDDAGDDLDDHWSALGITLVRDPMRDTGAAVGPEPFQYAADAVRAALAVPGSKILVHCHAGQYRSPSVIYALLRAAGATPEAAWARIAAARSDASRQYVDSAERAVPTLGSIDAVALGLRRSWGPVFLAGALAASLGALWASRRE